MLLLLIVALFHLLATLRAVDIRMAVPLPALGGIASINDLTALDILQHMDFIYIKPDALAVRAAVDSHFTVEDFFHTVMALGALDAVQT
jgi:hypothetical protein